MIQLHLTRGEHTECITLPLPATPAEIGEAYSLLDEIQLDPASTRILRVNSPIPNLEQYIKNTDLSEASALDRLNLLAENISKMSTYQKNVFSGALDAESINGLEDVVRLSQQVDSYVLITGVKSYRELGGFLVESGYKNFPDHVRPYLDYEGIAREYCDERGGAFSSTGYVLHKNQFHGQKKTEGAIFTLVLRSAQDRSCHLKLPATEEEIEQARQELCVEDIDQCSIDRLDYLPYLGDLIPHYGITVAHANYLALSIEEMHQRDDEFLKYLSVLAVEQPDSFQKALKLASNLDDYERVVESAYEYGQSVLRRHGADDVLMESLENYMDFELYGEDAMQEDGVHQTEFGLIRRCSFPFEEETCEMKFGGM